MSELHAAIGLVQMSKIKLFLKQRKFNYLYLNKLMKNIEGITLLPLESKRETQSYYCFIVILNNLLKKRRSLIIKELNKLGIGTSVYYPHPVPRLKWYKRKYGYNKKDFVNAEKFSDNTISFPVGPHLGRKEMYFIASNLKKIIYKLL